MPVVPARTFHTKCSDCRVRYLKMGGVEDSSLGPSEELLGCSILSDLFQARIGGWGRQCSLLRNNCTYLHPNPGSCGTPSLGR